MATYTELFNLRSDGALKNRVVTAVIVKAQNLIDAASPTATQIDWAEAAIANPVGKAVEILNYVLAANKDADVSAIQSATDDAIQSNVDAAVDVLIAGGP